MRNHRRKWYKALTMNKVVILLFALIMLLSGKASAQSSLEYVPVFQFKQQSVPFFLPVGEWQTGVAVPSDSFTTLSGKPLVQGKPYEAFFCKLEVRTESYFGFGLRIHAGDYDSDMKRYIP